MAILLDMILALCYIYAEGSHSFMKDSRKTYGVDMGGKRGRAQARGAGGVLAKKVQKSGVLHAFGRNMIAWS